MNNILKHTLQTGTLAVVGLLAFSSCSDSWDEHYDSAASVNYSGTTWEYLQSQDNLSDFVKVVEAAGYDELLKSSQVFTVLAPENGTFNRDSLLQSIAEGNKEGVITRFVENHILRYGVSINNTEKSAKLLNDKYVEIGTLANPTVGSTTAVQKNVTCTNGVLQVLDGSLPYYYNLYEWLQSDYEDYVKANGENDSLVSLYTFLRKYDDDELDVDRSVARGVDSEGNTVYVDSVMNRRNTALVSLDAYLYREDSNYVALIPSNEAYRQRVEEIKPFCTLNKSYNPDQTVLDSLTDYLANYYATWDLFYNMNVNTHTNDSVVSTPYSSVTWEQNVYYQPYAEDGIFSKVTDADKEECSNGQVYHVSEYPYTIYDSFVRKLSREAEYDVQSGDKWTSTTSTSWTNMSSTADSVSGSGYLYITPTTSTRQTQIAVELPFYFATTYDIYLRILPQTVRDDVDASSILPCRFRANLYERKADGEMEEKSATYQFKTADGSRNFETNAYRVDTVYLGRYTFANCYKQVNTTGAYLQLESYVTTSQRSNFTKEMLLDCIIMIPVKEDAATDETSASKRQF